MTTTITVDPVLRDRLNAQAAHDGVTLRQHLERYADLVDRERRFAALQETIAATCAEDLASWRAETAEWDRIRCGVSGS